MKLIAIFLLLLATTGQSLAAETVSYPQLPRDRQCSAIVDHGGGTVTVLIRCKGYIDWVVYSGPAMRETNSAVTERK